MGILLVIIATALFDHCVKVQKQRSPESSSGGLGRKNWGDLAPGDEAESKNLSLVPFSP